jgi:hypothetical protein
MRGKVVRFVVQLEIVHNDEWIPILRYDMAHGVPHVDRYETASSKSTRRLDLSPAAALTYADQRVNEHWMRYRDEFLRRNRS